MEGYAREGWQVNESPSLIHQSTYHAPVSVDPSTLRILIHPDPLLRQAAAAVDEVTEEVQAVAERMLELMHEAEGIGLAAPQVGLSWRMFVTRDPDNREATSGGVVYVNPVIEVTDEEIEASEEGCLSLPGIEVNVKRPVGIRMTALNAEGDSVIYERNDHFARVYQHESDHLDGTLIIDRMSAMDRIRNRRAIRDLEQV